MHFEIAEKLIEKASKEFGSYGIFYVSHAMKHGEKKLNKLTRLLVFVDIEKLIFEGIDFYPDFPLELLEDMKDKPKRYMRILERARYCIMKIPRVPKLCPKCGTVVDTQINEIWCTED